MKVLFLDFDGVLNTFTQRNFGEQFSPGACKNLKSLLRRVPDLKIVVSSAWRMWGLEYVKATLKKNGINSDRVIDITGQENGNRGYQIQCWLNKHPEVTSFVIIDDESDMGELMNKLVKTSSFIGLTEKEVLQAVELLNNQKE